MLTRIALPKAVKHFSFAVAAFAVVACSKAEKVAQFESGEILDLRQKIAQKLMLDIRYYCPDMRRPTPGDAGNLHCNQPVTELPGALAEMIRRNDIGGIILFADNLEDSAQIVRLNRQLQAAAQQSASGLPLLIGVDQEGGRVNRLPRDEAAAFAGNMAIGATYARHGEYFATHTAAAMGEQLKSLGFNVNFAPTLDVNSNPDNPVINVRSYGESPQMVADLGGASVAAFQQQGIAATVKHFPGHGDTSVDSHTGLPRVERPLEQAKAVDLLPFAQVIARVQPALTMTAHIQYPSLDNSVLRSKSGEEMLVPATLSRKILTDILREELHYQGVVVTDALDMAGISEYFTPDQAVVHTFAAGADIALMPIKIRYPDDLQLLDALIDSVTEAIANGAVPAVEIDESVARIEQLKQKYVNQSWLQQGEAEALLAAHQVLASPQHRALASELATSALTGVFTPGESTLPLITKDMTHVQVLAPNPAVGEAFRIALSAVTTAEIEVLDIPTAVDSIRNSAADALVVASIVPAESAVELGGMEDLGKLEYRRLDQETLYEIYREGLITARAKGAKTAFISMRSPYESGRFKELADVHLASFDYKAYIGPQQKLEGPIYRALAEALVSEKLPGGKLPVTVVAPAGNTASVPKNGRVAG